MEERPIIRSLLRERWKKEAWPVSTSWLVYFRWTRTKAHGTGRRVWGTCTGQTRTLKKKKKKKRPVDYIRIGRCRGRWVVGFGLATVQRGESGKRGYPKGKIPGGGQVAWPTFSSIPRAFFCAGFQRARWFMAAIHSNRLASLAGPLTTASCAVAVFERHRP